MNLSSFPHDELLKVCSVLRPVFWSALPIGICLCWLGWISCSLPAPQTDSERPLDYETARAIQSTPVARHPSPEGKEPDADLDAQAGSASSEGGVETGEIPPLDRPDIAEQYLRVPEGFRVELFADDDLAHDIYCMTFDSQGRVVVSGAGYVRILLDTNGDGRADTARQFADGPATGAQGMFFDGTDLLCVGDGGLLRYRDPKGEGRADGPPELLFPIRTGGEHHAHAIRRGPEGCWYLLAGNDSGIGPQHVQGPTSPVRRPEAGALLRLSSDFSQVVVHSDGFRNAYDFDFGPHGDPLVYDSDGERDISLPWYRPTRVFQMLAGSHAGWLSRSWKRPDYFADMPPVVTEAGRGSPTGVVLYQHRQFPSQYHQGLFIADWTFGRVHFVPLTTGSPGSPRAGVHSPVEPQEFVMGKGQFGFAPTDLEVGPEGDLFISVGGRGTRGGVYRVRWIGDQATSREANSDKDDEVPRLTDSDEPDLLTRCLSAVQPSSSWGRAAWYPLAKQLGRHALVAGVVDEQREPNQRCRAIEILTELHGGLDSRTLEKLHEAPETVRARAAWSIGAVSRSPASIASAWDDASVAEALPPFLRDPAPRVARWAVESLMDHAHRLGPDELEELLKAPLDHDSPWVRQTAARVISQHRQRLRASLLEHLETRTFRAQSTILLGLVERPEEVEEEIFWKANALLAEARTPGQWNRLIRIMQLAVGDQGPGHDGKPVLDGYASRLLREEVTSLRQIPLALWVEQVVANESSHGPVDRRRAWEWGGDATEESPADAAVAAANGPREAESKESESKETQSDEEIELDRESRPNRKSRLAGPEELAGPNEPESLANWTDVREELGRLAAMVSASDPAGLELALSPITADSHPTDDLHGLLVAACLTSPVSERDAERIARGLARLDEKLAARRLNQDRNWGPRLSELYERLRERVPGLQEALLEVPEFGQASHAWLVEGMSGEGRSDALERLLSRIDETATPSRILEVVRLVEGSDDPAHRAWLRSMADQPAVRGAILIALAAQAEEVDRPLFVEGLGMWQPEVVRAGLRALQRLPAREDPEEWGALIGILMKWNRDRQELAIRDQAGRLLRRGTGRAGLLKTGEEGYGPQEEAVRDWVQWFSRHYPDLAERQGLDAEGDESLERMLADVPWDEGKVERGEKLFERKACGICHTGRSALGPDLTGITQRFSRRDLFVAIVDPSRDVSSRYATTVIETHDGRIYRGAVIYESVDGLTLSTGDLQTVRIERDEIARQDVSPVSLMPTGLLDDCRPRDYADLFKYLQTLTRR